MQNLATRTAPTTFILVAHNHKTETAMTRMQTLYSCLNNPVSNLKDAIISKLRDKEYIALVCEVCRNPVSKDYYYEISNPKEFVGKILPLANAGLKFVCILNSVAQLATCLGVPSLDPSMLDEAQSFLDIMGSTTFDDYQSVQVSMSEVDDLRLNYSFAIYMSNMNHLLDRNLLYRMISTLACAYNRKMFVKHILARRVRGRRRLAAPVTHLSTV